MHSSGDVDVFSAVYAFKGEGRELASFAPRPRSLAYFLASNDKLEARSSAKLICANFGRSRFARSPGCFGHAGHIRRRSHGTDAPKISCGITRLTNCLAIRRAAAAAGAMAQAEAERDFIGRVSPHKTALNVHSMCTHELIMWVVS